MISLILLVFAFVLLCLAAKNIGAPNWSLGWAVMACYILSLILGSLGGHVALR
jgi:type IV secretory pathway VirB2 component (pilin)